jgi:hypothetical protein
VRPGPAGAACTISAATNTMLSAIRPRPAPRHVEESERGAGERDAVRDRERGDRRDQLARAVDQEQQREHEQQVVDAEQDVLDAEQQGAQLHRSAAPDGSPITLPSRPSTVTV